MNTQDIILVNERDEAVGTMEKMEAHQKGLLHRAFSVFIFDRAGQLLLQQRAAKKYHGAGLWSNSCCSHPYPGEDTRAAAERRLAEELGFSVPLQKVFDFTYEATVENGLTEHEFDHVFAGEYEGTVFFNEEEVAAYRYESIERIQTEMDKNPANFTSWFRIVFPRVQAWWKTQYPSIKNDDNP